MSDMTDRDRLGLAVKDGIHLVRLDEHLGEKATDAVLRAFGEVPVPDRPGSWAMVSWQLLMADEALSEDERTRIATAFSGVPELARLEAQREYVRDMEGVVLRNTGGEEVQWPQATG